MALSRTGTKEPRHPHSALQPWATCVLPGKPLSGVIHGTGWQQPSPWASAVNPTEASRKAKTEYQSFCSSKTNCISDIHISSLQLILNHHICGDNAKIQPVRLKLFTGFQHMNFSCKNSVFFFPWKLLPKLSSFGFYCAYVFTHLHTHRQVYTSVKFCLLDWSFFIWKLRGQDLVYLTIILLLNGAVW